MVDPDLLEADSYCVGDFTTIKSILMLRKVSYIAIWVFALLGTACVVIGYSKDNSDQLDYGLVWCGIAIIAALVYRYSKRRN